MDLEELKELCQKPSWLWILIGTPARGTLKTSGGGESWITSSRRLTRRLTFTIGRRERFTMIMKINVRSTDWQFWLVTRKRRRSCVLTSTLTSTKRYQERSTEITWMSSVPDGEGDSKQWKWQRNSRTTLNSSADGVPSQKKQVDHAPSREGH